MPLCFSRFLLLCFVLLAGGSAMRAAESPSPEMVFLYGCDELFPSVLVSLTGNSPVAPIDPAQLGDPRGVIAARVSVAQAGATVRVTLAATPFFAESTVAVILPEAGRAYRIAPTIRFFNDRLAALRQPVANLVLKLTVEIDGKPREIFRRVVVHGIRDCPVAWPAAVGVPAPEWQYLAPFLLAAYANENHPAVDQKITHRAYQLTTPKVKQFSGYVFQQAMPLPVISSRIPGVLSSLDTEIEAIYLSLQALGFRHVNVGRPSVAATANQITIRSVRLMGEVVASAQASELEAALVFASVLRKLAVDAAIIFLPEDRVLLGVYRRPGFDPDDIQPIDLRHLATANFAAAVKAGEQAYAPHRAALWPKDTRTEEEKKAHPRARPPLTAGEFPRVLALDLDAVRALGVLPIPEAR